MQITAVSRLIQPKHTLEFTLFSTSELCGIDEGRKALPSIAKGVVESFWVLFFGKNCEALLNAKRCNKQEMKKVPAIARHEGRQACAEKASATSLPFKWNLKLTLLIS